MSKFDTYFLMTTEDAIEYAKLKVPQMEWDAESMECKEIGDGNLNYVFKVTDGRNHSVIIKQAGGVARISEDMKLDTDRNRIESEILVLQGKLAPGYVPEIYFYDTVMSACGMQDLSDHEIMRTAMLEHKIFPKFADQISTFMAQVLMGTTDVVMEMKLGKMSVKSDPEGRATFTLGRFDQNNKITQQELEQLYLDIEALPESAVIYASVSQKEAEDMFTLMEKTKDKVDLQWLQIYETESNFQAGVSLNLSCAYSDQDRRDDMDADDIRRIYIKNLETLRDNFDIWKDLGLYSVSSVYNSDNTEIIDDLLSEAKEHDLLESKNYCISGSRDEVLIYLQAWEAEWDNVQIDKVNYSKFG